MEKSKKFYVSLYILIPFVLAGFAVLFVVLTFRITEYFIKHGESITWPIFTLAGLAGLILFSFGILTVWMLLNPVQQFIKKAEAMPALDGVVTRDDHTKQEDEINKAVRIFGKVTDALNKVDSKQLFPKIIGESKLIRSVFNQIKKVSPTDTTVLVLGESGTGKELIASSIHEHSKRHDKPFIKINCVAIPAELLESELFGHEKGAFTGAVAKKIGKFELAQGGTVFLDEIGDMPLGLQAKLLRVLQEKEFDRVGGRETIKVDIRFIAATSKNLVNLIKDGEFRDDLYYRLNVFAIQIPELNKRKDDIIPLVNYFLSQSAEKIDITKEALKLLIQHQWPGNVRALRNTIERAIVLAENNEINTEHLTGLTEDDLSQQHLIATQLDGLSLDEKLRNIEKELIVNALIESKGIQVKASELLGVKQRSLWNRIKKYEINVGDIRKHA